MKLFSLITLLASFNSFAYNFECAKGFTKYNLTNQRVLCAVKVLESQKNKWDCDIDSLTYTVTFAERSKFLCQEGFNHDTYEDDDNHYTYCGINYESEHLMSDKDAPNVKFLSMYCPDENGLIGYQIQLK